jgi:hypothetical protein
VLDASIMNIALPSIGTELDVSQESLPGSSTVTS